VTTIACNLKEMAGDSCITFEDIGIGTGQAPTKKLHRIGKSIFGERGENMAGVHIMLDWIRGGAKLKRRPDSIPKGADFYLLELSPKGIFLWTSDFERDVINEPNFAIGSGAKVALYCMRYLNMGPRKAVEEAARVDAYTKGPFALERL
jgi:hypothetical protein